MVNVLLDAQSSLSMGGRVQASLDEEDILDDEFQTHHTPISHVVQWDEYNAPGSVKRMDFARGSPAYLLYYQVNIGKEKETLENVNLKWRVCCWLQLAVQGIADEEVPWFELVAPLTSGAEGTALTLAKCLIVIWRWSQLVKGTDTCPPAPAIFNVGQFMTEKEVMEKVGELHWYIAYSCALQRVGEAVTSKKWAWLAKEGLEVQISPLVLAFWRETGVDLMLASLKLC